MNALAAFLPPPTSEIPCEKCGFPDFPGFAYVADGTPGYGPKKIPMAILSKLRTEKNRNAASGLWCFGWVWFVIVDVLHFQVAESKRGVPLLPPSPASPNFGV